MAWASGGSYVRSRRCTSPSAISSCPNPSRSRRGDRTEGDAIRDWWALALFHRSVLKQAKFRHIVARLDDPAGKRGLDIGADNGVISYLRGQRGGRWHSADLDERAVMSIRQLVGSNVPHLKPGSLLNRVRDAIGLTDEWHGHLRQLRLFDKTLKKKQKLALLRRLLGRPGVDDRLLLLTNGDNNGAMNHVVRQLGGLKNARTSR